VINTSNYEIYFLDYIDGQLDDESVRQLHAFLDQHPALKQELLQLSSEAVLPPIALQMPGKDSLKRDALGCTALDYRMIALLENDLSQEDRSAFLKEVDANPRMQQQLKQWQQTVITPNNDIVFKHKAQLKRPAAKVFLLRRVLQYGAVAASLLLGYFYLNDRTDVGVTAIIEKPAAMASPAAAVASVSPISERSVMKKSVTVAHPFQVPQVVNPQVTQRDSLTTVEPESITPDQVLTAVPVTDTPFVVAEEIFSEEEIVELIALQQAQPETISVEYQSRRSLFERLLGIHTSRTETVIDDNVVVTVEAGRLMARHVKTK
jgi:anti-sigma factor RsiW